MSHSSWSIQYPTLTPRTARARGRWWTLCKSTSKQKQFVLSSISALYVSGAVTSVNAMFAEEDEVEGGKSFFFSLKQSNIFLFQLTKFNMLWIFWIIVFQMSIMILNNVLHVNYHSNQGGLLYLEKANCKCNVTNCSGHARKWRNENDSLMAHKNVHSPKSFTKSLTSSKENKNTNKNIKKGQNGHHTFNSSK